MKQQMMTTVGLGLILGFGCAKEPGDKDTRPPARLRTGADIACRSEHCGNPELRGVVPVRSTFHIPFAGTSKADSPGSTRAALIGEPSEDYIAVADHVDWINRVIEEVFEDIEYTASGTPESETATALSWRAVDPGDAALDRIAEVERTGDESFAFAYYEGPTGFEPTAEDASVIGTIGTDADGVASLQLAIHLDNDENSDASGDIEITVEEVAEGLFDIQFDVVNGHLAGSDETETSETTFWMLGGDEYALEYLATLDDNEDADVYVHWGEDGGRFDQISEYNDEIFGTVTYAASNCWDASGDEVFDAEVEIDAEGNWHGTSDGDESDCEYTIVDDYHGDTNWDAFPDAWDEGEFECDPETMSCEPETCEEDDFCDEDCDSDPDCEEPLECQADDFCDEECVDDPDCKEPLECEADDFCDEECVDDPDCKESFDCEEDGFCDKKCDEDPDC